MPCGLVAVEENRDKIAGNVISNLATIENAKLAYGKLSHLEADAVADAVASTARMPLWGVDTALTVPDVMSAMEMLVTQKGCKVVAIDHIHLLGTGRRENRNDELRDISAAMKSAFKRLNIVGIVAAQLSRPPEKGREPPPPHLSDLRESGSLEEHADAALMLHRRDYYHRGERNYSPDHLCQAFVRKNRNGAVGEIVLRAELEYQRFVDESAVDPWSEAA
jgi:replicative DNA helicase